MLNINLKLAFRNIMRNKLYTAINLIGLGVASAFCILVYLYVKNEQSFDSFHKDGAQLYGVEESSMYVSSEPEKVKKSFFSFMTSDAEQKNMTVTPPILAVDLKRNLPEIEQAVRFAGVYQPVVHVGTQNFSEKNESVTYADAEFFKTFDFPLVKGNPETVLSGSNAVISERAAKKYFRDADPIGKVISIPNENKVLYTVAGVAKNFPANSSMQFDVIIPLQSDPDYLSRLNNGLNSFNEPLVLKLKAGTDVARFRQKLDAFGKNYFKPAVEAAKKRDPKSKVADVHIFLRQFAKAHYSNNTPWNHYTDLAKIYQLIGLTIVILFIACLNYILLTLTSAISRSQDVGIRKTIGAGRVQIILQYYTETQLLALVSVMAGLVMAVLCLPFFSSLTGATLQLSYFSFSQIGSLLLGLVIVLGLVAGVYPALAMSGLKPLNIMRSFSAYKLNPMLSKGLVVVQFTICVVLIISALVMNKQMGFINQADMGFDSEQVVILKSPYSWTEKQKTKALSDDLYHYASTQPAIQNFTTTSFMFGGYNNNNFLIGGEKHMLEALNVDYNYFSFNKIPIVDGRTFSRDIASDSIKMSIPELQKNQKASLALRNVVVNQTLYNMLGKPKLDVLNNDMGAVIIGVCKDYHTEDLTKKIGPVYHMINSTVNSALWVKIRAGQSIPAVMGKLKSHWNQQTGNLPFDYTFLDTQVAKSYADYLRWMTTITTSCVLAIIIACLGLFGLSGLTTINRTKEIGIRKVLGASVANLFLLLNRGTLLLALASFVIAAPIAFYLVRQWLDNFAYRIEPDWTLFTVAGVIAMATAILAVSFHTVKAAIANPVKSLRSE